MKFPVSSFHEVLTEMKLERDLYVARRKARFRQRLPYRVSFWLFILFALYLAYPH